MEMSLEVPGDECKKSPEDVYMKIKRAKGRVININVKDVTL